MAMLSSSLPFVLFSGGYISEQIPLQKSLSQYYHTPMGDVFVGVLCIVGLFLFFHKNPNGREKLALKMAGAFAIGIALLPTDNTDICQKVSILTMTGNLHLVCAIGFFLAMTYLYIFLARGKCTKDNNKHRLLYKACSSLLVLCMGFGILAHQKVLGSYFCEIRPMFIVESASILISSIYFYIGKNY